MKWIRKILKVRGLTLKKDLVFAYFYQAKTNKHRSRNLFLLSKDLLHSHLQTLRKGMGSIDNILISNGAIVGDFPQGGINGKLSLLKGA